MCVGIRFVPDVFKTLLIINYNSVAVAWYVNSFFSVLAMPWWRHQMETFSALLAICAGNSPVNGEFPGQRPVTRSFDVFFELRLNKRLSKQSRGWWFETLSRPLWRHCNGIQFGNYYLLGMYQCRIQWFVDNYKNFGVKCSANLRQSTGHSEQTKLLVHMHNEMWVQPKLWK